MSGEHKQNINKYFAWRFRGFKFGLNTGASYSTSYKIISVRIQQGHCDFLFCFTSKFTVTTLHFVKSAFKTNGFSLNLQNKHSVRAITWFSTEGYGIPSVTWIIAETSRYSSCNYFVDHSKLNVIFITTGFAETVIQNTMVPDSRHLHVIFKDLKKQKIHEFVY